MSVPSNDLAQMVLDYIFGLGSDGPVAATFYVALNTVLVDPDGSGGTEVSGGGYARVAVDPTTDFERTGQIVENSADIDFGVAGSDWGPSGTPVVAYSVWDAASGGNLLLSQTLGAPRIILNTDPVKFPIGSLQITVN